MTNTESLLERREARRARPFSRRHDERADQKRVKLLDKTVKNHISHILTKTGYAIATVNLYKERECKNPEASLALVARGATETRHRTRRNAPDYRSAIKAPFGAPPMHRTNELHHMQQSIQLRQSLRTMLVHDLRHHRVTYRLF